MGRNLAGFLSLMAVLALMPACGGGGGGSSAPTPPAVPGRAYGGAGIDGAWSAQPTADGGCVFAGFTQSSGAGGYDAWVVKTDGAGQVTHQATFGSAGRDFAFGIQQTVDGGYIVTGVDGDVVDRTPGTGAWLPLDASGELTLRKLNTDLSLAWETRFGPLESNGSAYAYAMGCAVQQTADGGYVVAGATGTGGGGGQTLLLKTDSTGVRQWHSFLEGELGLAVVQMGDGGYAVATSNAGLIRTTPTGLVQWNQTFANGGSALSVCLCSDGGLAVTGAAGTNSGDVYLARLTSGGDISWQRTLGTSGGDIGLSLQATADGGLVLAGAGGDVPNHHFEAYLIRVDGTGTPLWQQTFGGTGDEVARCVRQRSEGGFILAGSTTSKGGGSLDAYLVKLDGSGRAVW